VLFRSWKPKKTKVKKLTWTSSAPEIATVNSGGKVTAISAGTATITAKNTYGKKATCKVTVKKPYTVDSISSTVSYNTNPNGSAKYAWIWVNITFSNMDPEYYGGFNIDETLRTTDYSYGSNPAYNYFTQTQGPIGFNTRNSDGTGSATVPTRVYSILYGGTTGAPTTYTVKCLDKTHNIGLPYRAASFTPGNGFNTD
jgi:hypothetical protein